MSRLTRSLGAVGMFAALALSSTAYAQSEKIAFIAELDAAQVVTPSTSTAMGTAVVIIDPATNVMEIEVVIDGLAGAETATHIHGYVDPGVGGPPQHTLPLGLQKTSTWVYPEADEASILRNLAYVKVHSAAFPTGEIRGQLNRVRKDFLMVGKMDAAQVIAGSASTASGLFVATVDTLTNAFSYQMTMTESLLMGAETASHIHGYAPPGLGGPPQNPLALGFHKKAFWTYPEVDEASILGELAYAKVHTAANPAGEIRGQIEIYAINDPADRIAFVADLDAAQIVAGSTSTATGTACMVVDTRSNVAELTVVVDGLVGTETSTHIHGFAAPGAAGPPQFTLPLGDYKFATWVYPEADEASILSGLAYVKFHSSVFPTGEIRGQLTRALGDVVLIGDMDGPQIVAGSASTARGLFCAVLDTTTNGLSYQMTMTGSSLMGIETASHIHGFAIPGVGGPPQHTLPLGNQKSGFWTYPEVDEASLLGQLAYAKVHTDVNPTGEIRGQMRLAAVCASDTVSYCTAGVSAAGCIATLSATGLPSATLPSGFTVASSTVEGQKDGLFFFGSNGRQANSWGNGSSFQCVVPPVRRGGLIPGNGTVGSCDGVISQDLNALWCATCPKPAKNPGAGTTVQAQLWYRDPQNTSNQTTSLSDALEFTVCP